MGSLNLGSINLWDGVYNNRIADILYYARELKKHRLQPYLNCFDLSHFGCLPILEKQCLIPKSLVFGFIFDIPNALPFKERYLDIFLNELPKNSTWFLARHHAKGAEGFMTAIERGGHVRVGYEDGPFLSSGRRALSNKELVEEVAEAAEKAGRSVVHADRAREIMGLDHPKYYPATSRGQSNA
jgi:uncharacterized protein (DUF849 family)